MTTFPDYPPLPDYLPVAPRYTTLAAVKIALGIDDGSLDSVVTEAILVMETMIDVYLGTSYPQTPDPSPATSDALDPAPIVGIPELVKKAAKLGAIALTKLDDAPFGTAGSDEFFGVIEPDNAGRAFASVKPILVGLRRSWGVG